MNYKLKKILKKPLIWIPALFLLFYSVINYFTYYSQTAKISAVIAFIVTIVWLIANYKD